MKCKREESEKAGYLLRSVPAALSYAIDVASAAKLPLASSHVVRYVFAGSLEHLLTRCYWLMLSPAAKFSPMVSHLLEVGDLTSSRVSAELQWKIIT
jgi:hypothetical protein